MEIGILEYQKFHSVYSNTLEQICEDHRVYLYNDPKQAKKESKQLDLLFVNTIRPLPWDIIKWLRFKSKCKTILTIQEANTDLFFNRILLNKFDAISVLHPPIKDYILEKKMYRGKIFTFPWELHEKVYPNTNNMIVVPGKIEGFRRDYNAILKIQINDANVFDYSDYFSINMVDTVDQDPTPTPDLIPSFNPLIIIGIIGCISAVSAILIKKK